MNWSAGVPRHRLSRLLLLLVGGCLGIGIAGPPPAAGQDGGTLRGIVTSAEDGRALRGANVVLRTLDGRRVGATATDLDGYYELESVPPAQYQFRVSFVGFAPHRDTVEVEEGGTRINVVLPPRERALEGVRVEADRGAAHREAGVQTVGAAGLDRIPTPGPSGDLASYLQTLPGVVSGGDRGGQLYVRGGTPSQNLVRVDGLSIVKPFHISNLYSAFPQEVVKSADIHAGGFGAEYLGALSSVIDVTLREGNMEEYAASASSSPFLASARVEGPIEEGSESFLGVVRHSLIRHTADPLIGEAVPLRFYDVTGRYSLRASDASCSFTGMRTFDRGEINPERNTVLRWTNTTVGGNCLFFGEQLAHALDVNVGYTRFRNSAGSRAAPERSASVQKGYFSVKREQDLWRGTIDFGGRWTFSKYGYSLGEKFTALESDDLYVNQLQGFLAGRWEIGDRLTVSPSVGTQYQTVAGVPTLEPRLRLAYRPGGTDRQAVTLALGKYNQAVEGITDERDAGTVFTVWTPSTGQDGIPEALHGILGYRRQVGSVVEVSVEGYGKKLTDIPVPKWTPVARLNTQTTPASGVVYGADLQSELTLDSFYLFLGYGWSTVTYRADSGTLGAWVQGEVVEYTPSHDRRHQVSAVASYEFGDFTANLNWEFGTGRPYTKLYGLDLAVRTSTLEESPTTDAGTALTLFDRPYGARLPPYHRLDLSLSRVFEVLPRFSLEVKAGAINTYDRSNIFYYDVKTLSRVDQTPLLPYVSLRAQIN